MKEKILVWIKEPHKKPKHVYITNVLPKLQKIVGGYIETVTVADDLVVICDEEGRFKDYQACCRVSGLELVGTVIFAGINGDEFGDCPLDASGMKILFPKLWENCCD